MSIRLDYKQVSNALHKDSVAVIIPCYNSSKYIRKTLDSVLNQDYKYLEIVAIDDGSTDETREILESYLPKIRILSHPNNANLGPAASRNLGIKSTDADLVAFLDHDDIWHPTKIREQVTIFENYPNAGLVHTNGYAIDESDNILYELMPRDFREPDEPEAILLSCYIKTPSSVMVRRDFLERVGMFYQDFPVASDHDLWIRMKEITRFYFLAKHLLGYREHGTQLSRQRAMWEAGFDVLKRATTRYPYSLEAKRRRLAVLHYRLGMWDLMNRHYRHAFRNLFLALVLDPYRSISILRRVPIIRSNSKGGC